jgi:nicotinamidase-related amidase
MKALIIVDAQNEFSPQGRRPVPNHAHALETILRRVAEARGAGRPIAWVRHHNRPEEYPAFAPGSWGAAYSPGLGPLPGRDEEAEFVKNVYGAFTGTDIGSWLAARGVGGVLIVGFFVHMCVSTTAREALMRGLHVAVDPTGTGGFPIRHELLGEQSAAEVHRTALLQLSHLGVTIAGSEAQHSWSAE